MVVNALNDGVAHLRRVGVQVSTARIDDAVDSLAEIDKIGTFPPIELAAALRALR